MNKNKFIAIALLLFTSLSRVFGALPSNISLGQIENAINQSENIVQQAENIINQIDDAATQLENQATQVIANGNDILKQFKISGWSYSISPNVACILDSQSLHFPIFYTNSTGETKQRIYQASFKSIGLKLQCALKLYLIFFVNTNFDFYNSNETIQLGHGIEALLPVQHLLKMFGISKSLCPVNPEVTYISFTNTPGGLLLIGIPLGINPFGLNLSYVTSGGTLSPVS